MSAEKVGGTTQGFAVTFFAADVDAGFVQILSPSGAAIGGGGTFGIFTGRPGDTHLVLDAVSTEELLAHVGFSIPADWFAKVSGTEDDD